MIRGCLAAALLFAASSGVADDCMATIGYSTEAMGVFTDVASPDADGLFAERSPEAHRAFVDAIFQSAEYVQSVRETMPDTPAAAAWDRALGEIQHALRFMALWADFYRSDPLAATDERYVTIMSRNADSSRRVNDTLPGGSVWQGLLVLSGCTWADWEPPQ